MPFLCFLQGIPSRPYCVGFYYPVFPAFSNWHERRRCNNVSGHYFCNSFILFPFSLFHSLLRPFLTERVFGSKEWFGAANDLGLDPFLDPGGHFGDPCWPFLILHKNYVIFPGIFLFSKYIFQLIGTTICTGLDMYKS